MAMKFRNDRILLYTGMADSFLKAVEYAKYRTEAGRKLRDAALRCDRYLAHPTHDMELEEYTDDTEMCSGNAHVLIDYDAPFLPIQFANAYVHEFNRGGRRNGYSRPLQKILEECLCGDDLMRRVGGDSVANGAMMRAMVFGVMSNVRDMFEAVDMQARITHDTPEGRFSALLVAIMSRYALYHDLPLSDLPAYCDSLLPREYRNQFGHVLCRRWNSAVTKRRHESVAITTANAVMELLVHGKSLMDMLRTTIRWGGDTDSVGAITWGIASARFQDEQLPEFLERDLEGGDPRTGATYLRNLGTALMNKYDQEDT